MESTLSALSGLAGGVILALVVAVIALKTPSPYADWLGKRCWVRPVGRESWAQHVIVAVSWKGAVCVRRLDKPDDDGYWIKKQNVSWRVRWDRPRGASEG